MNNFRDYSIDLCYLEDYQNNYFIHGLTPYYLRTDPEMDPELYIVFTQDTTVEVLKKMLTKALEAKDYIELCDLTLDVDNVKAKIHTRLMKSEAEVLDSVRKINLV